MHSYTETFEKASLRAGFFHELFLNFSNLFHTKLKHD
jgi:hypothetical protein